MIWNDLLTIHSNKYLEVGRFRVDRWRSTKSRISSIYSGATGFCCKRIRESVHFCRWKSLPRIEFILLCILSIILESHSPLLRVVLTLKARCRLFSLYIYIYIYIMSVDRYISMYVILTRMRHTINWKSYLSSTTIITIRDIVADDF